MDELTLHSDAPNTYSRALRLICFLAGTALFVIPPGSFSATELDISTLLLKILGMGLVVLAVVDPIALFWKDHQLQLNDEFIKATDELSIERTAYWKRLDKIILSRFSLRLVYHSGMGEQFHLPFINNEQFEQLQSRIQAKSEEHQFDLEERSWWEI